MQFTQSISTLATELIDLDGLANVDYVPRGATFLCGGPVPLPVTGQWAP